MQSKQSGVHYFIGKKFLDASYMAFWVALSLVLVYWSLASYMQARISYLYRAENVLDHKIKAYEKPLIIEMENATKTDMNDWSDRSQVSVSFWPHYAVRARFRHSGVYVVLKDSFYTHQEKTNIAFVWHKYLVYHMRETFVVLQRDLDLFQKHFKIFRTFSTRSAPNKNRPLARKSILIPNQLVNCSQIILRSLQTFHFPPHTSRNKVTGIQFTETHWRRITNIIIINTDPAIIFINTRTNHIYFWVDTNSAQFTIN